MSWDRKISLVQSLPFCSLLLHIWSSLPCTPFPLAVSPPQTNTKWITSYIIAYPYIKRHVYWKRNPFPTKRIKKNYNLQQRSVKNETFFNAYQSLFLYTKSIKEKNQILPPWYNVLVVCLQFSFLYFHRKLTFFYLHSTNLLSTQQRKTSEQNHFYHFVGKI